MKPPFAQISEITGLFMNHLYKIQGVQYLFIGRSDGFCEYPAIHKSRIRYGRSRTTNRSTELAIPTHRSPMSSTVIRAFDFCYVVIILKHLKIIVM